jgi:hypothetical protein
MKLSFVPGELYLTEEDGSFCVSFKGNPVLTTKAKKKALDKYHAIRKELEASFPAPELTQDQKEEIRRQASLDSLLSHNSLRSQLRKKPARSRTFG